MTKRPVQGMNPDGAFVCQHGSRMAEGCLVMTGARNEYPFRLMRARTAMSKLLTCLAVRAGSRAPPQITCRTIHDETIRGGKP